MSSYGELLKENILQSQREDVQRLKNMLHGKTDSVFKQILDGVSEVEINFNLEDSLFLFENYFLSRCENLITPYLKNIFEEELEKPLNKNGLKLIKPGLRWREEIRDGLVFRVEPKE